MSGEEYDSTQNRTGSFPDTPDFRYQLMERIINERERQINLPGSEWDIKNTPNDWIAIASHYLAEETRRNSVIPNKNNFEDSLIKAGAVILAALEHVDIMEERKTIKNEGNKNESGGQENST